MKSPPVSLLLGVCVLLSGPTVSAVSLNVSPNLQQFFSGDSVSLSCVEDGQTRGQTGGQTVKRTSGGQTGDCGSGFGTSDGSSCTVSGLSRSDSGVYWCGTSSGETSLQVNISVTHPPGHVILEIPTLPVMTGSDVTLRCRARDKSRREAYFFRDGVPLRSDPDGEYKISGVQQSHEGFYWCSTDAFGESPQSWLRVRDPPPPPPSSPLPSSPPPLSSPPSSSPKPDTSSPPPSPSLFTTPVIAALVSVVLLVLLLLLVVILLQRRRKQTGSPSSAPDDLIYADVTMRQAANRRDKHSSDEDTVYSGVRKHTAGSDEVTYGQVVIKGQRTAGRRTAQPDPEVLYSSVRAVC